ncbi:MAG: class I SAM-dependent methyltransferase [Patescibacteria group bacterium]|nr:class I SAM-dependent methyltransferase [Patescibacteria group bacterium]
MNYSEFVGLIDERNRPSGGIKSVHTVSINSQLNPSKKVLEIGSNTGFTSVNLSLLTGCKVVGIDSNMPSIAKAGRYAKEHGVDQDVSFMNADACDLPFEESYFDMIWCSNVTSFISDKKKAVSEYMRVLKPGGILVFIPIYYIDNPPQVILNNVSDAIGATIDMQGKKHWTELIDKTSKMERVAMELFFDEDYRYFDAESDIAGYINTLMMKDEVLQLGEKEQSTVKERAEYFYKLFNENLQYVGYSILLYQKRRMKDEVELFLSKKV